MSEPFVGEIKVWAGNFAPRGYAACNGQLLPISQNTALFSILGTTYGGNGQTNFALPDLQGRAPMHAGDGPGLTPRVLGEAAGSPNVTLLITELPSHNHPLSGSSRPATATNAEGQYFARTSPPGIYNPGTNPILMAPMAISPVGGSQPHNNLQPYLTLTFIIALSGIFPPRS